MFKVNISNASQNLSWSATFPTEIEAQEWLKKQIGKPHRLPEMNIENEDGSITVVPAEFTSEIINLSLDPTWVEKDIQEKREKKYPAISLVVEALIEAVAENRPQKLNQIQALRQAVKDKYPKAK